MAGPGHSRWRQWLKRSPFTYCSKKILLLLAWQVLFTFSWLILADIGQVFIVNRVFLYVYSHKYISYFFGPLIGWLADFKFGRYSVIKFASMASFLTSVLLFLVLITGLGVSTLSNSLLTIASIVVNFGATCYLATMLPFLTDQIIGATSDELSAVVQWYFWAGRLGFALSDIGFGALIYIKFQLIGPGIALIFAVPLAVIIISDCLCQQWLDRTHKVTNPIKLIIQVLNYTRKHRYPERRSAFTYIDEEQPTRMDYGKEKFGGPFTEEEVEDVKTVLRLFPMVLCLTLSMDVSSNVQLSFLPSNVFPVNVLNYGLQSWFFSLILIPLYQLFVRPCIRNCSPTMLRCFGISLVLYTLSYLVLQALEVYGKIVESNNKQQLYLTCSPFNITIQSDGLIAWYWKSVPFLLYGIGRTLCNILLLEFILAQSPEKMKGLAFGVMIAFQGLSYLLIIELARFNICYDIGAVVVFIVLFVIFLILSKRYTLRERNREINIQAIVEEHYERYMDQEEEYMKHQHY